MNYLLPITLALGFLAGIFFTNNAYEAKIQEENNSRLLKIRDIEDIYNKRYNKLITYYTQEVEDLNEQHKKDIDTIKSSNLSNTVKCLPDTTNTERVSKKTTTKPSSICYTETDLHRKIKESMAITSDCDKLAIKYNTLLETCKED